MYFFYFYFYLFFFDKVLKLIGEGSVINGAYPVQFVSNHMNYLEWSKAAIPRCFRIQEGRSGRDGQTEEHTQLSVFESTTYYDKTFTTHFLVPFCLLVKIFFSELKTKKSFFLLCRVTLRSPPKQKIKKKLKKYPYDEKLPKNSVRQLKRSVLMH